MINQVLEAIYQRRSTRSFTDEPVAEEDLQVILDAGRWAPSGVNNQPWRFVIIQNQAKKDELAQATRYGEIIRKAPVCIAVFLDSEACYHQVKDAQGAGACLQNILLAAHSLNLGAVWLGEILKNSEMVRNLLEVGSTMELQAVVALGHPKHRDQKSERKPLGELIVGRW